MIKGLLLRSIEFFFNYLKPSAQNISRDIAPTYVIIEVWMERSDSTKKPTVTLFLHAVGPWEEVFPDFITFLKTCLLLQLYLNYVSIICLACQTERQDKNHMDHFLQSLCEKNLLIRGSDILN